MRRGAIGCLVGAIGLGLAVGVAACGASEPNDFPAPPPSAPGATRATTATTGRDEIAATTSTPSPCGTPAPGASDPTGSETGAPDTATPASADPCGTAPDPTPADTTPGSAPTPRLNALTAFLTNHYGDEPWRSQLSDYNLSTVGDTFQLDIKVRSTLDVNQAIDVCTAVTKWSTSTFADGTISIKDSSGKALAGTSSARNRTCVAS